ncbi:MAG: permease-like cell division protein FtsX [Candidatus Berkelbacteria bacterium]
MRIESAKRIFKLGLTNFWRNSWLSFAATLIMTLTLLVVGFFVISSVAINKITDKVRAKMDVSVYFNDSASTSQITDLQKQLAARTDVKTVTYISKEDALMAFEKQTQNKQIASVIDPNDNPLPRSLEIKAIQAESIPVIAESLKQESLKPIIHNISYQDNKDLIDRLVAITAFTREFGWMLCGIFILISILVVINTTRLAMFTRKDEIEIMRLVGASDAFIKYPFVLEGLIYGLLATIMSMSIVWIGLFMILPRTTHYLGQANSQLLLVFFSGNFWAMLGLDLLVGMAIGVFCSLISIKKYLKF